MALKGRGWDCRFVVLLNSPAQYRAQKLGLVTYSTKFKLRDFRQLRDTYLRDMPGAVFTYGGKETSLVSVMIDKSRSKFFRIKGDRLNIERPFFDILFRLAHRKVDKIIAPSEVITRDIDRFERDSARTVTLGCNAETFRHIETRLGERPTLLVVGRLDPVKGHAQFFRLLKRLKEQWVADIPFPLLHVLGEAANVSVAQLQQTAWEFGLSLSDIVFTDRRVDNLPAVMNQATAGVVCSQGSEYICRVAEEFLLCGVPILVSGVGGLPDIMEPGFGYNYGLNTDDGTLREIERFIKASWTENTEERAKRSLRAKERYSFAAMAHALEEILEN
jgi:glycosyltransferase involved in cell wall biosynthesis